jgi:hypothetical protein
MKKTIHVNKYTSCSVIRENDVNGMNRLCKKTFMSIIMPPGIIVAAFSNNFDSNGSRHNSYLKAFIPIFQEI